ncbi:MAG TPA: hypothetical protein DD434_08765 [Bacteroidales bacterium]|nr:hypothetical protein [Bacteroidales bacterium]
MEKKFKKRTNWNTLIILCVNELFVFFFIVIIGYNTFIEIIYNRDTSFLFSFILLVSVGTIILDFILWQIRGYEYIKIDNTSITIKKRGKIFNTTNIINLSDVDDIYLQEFKTTLFTLFLKMMGIRGGKICIEYLGRKTYIGQSLTNKEAVENIDELKKKLENNNHIN